MTAKGLHNLTIAATAAAQVETLPGGGIVASGEAAVTRFHLLALLGALRLQAVGLKRRGPSALTIARNHYGIKARTAKAAYIEFRALLAERGIIGMVELERP